MKHQIPARLLLAAFCAWLPLTLLFSCIPSETASNSTRINITFDTIPPNTPDTLVWFKKPGKERSRNGSNNLHPLIPSKSLPGTIPKIPRVEDKVQLLQNFPNPFNYNTQLKFFLATPTTLTLKVFNSSGREIAILSGGKYDAGWHDVTWNGQSNTGELISGGVYLAQLQTPLGSSSIKMIRWTSDSFKY